MANFRKVLKPVPVIAKISRKALADVIGTTCTRVDFFNRRRYIGITDHKSGRMDGNSPLVSVVPHR